MSKSHFDDLARNLATPMPRRQALRLAAGALAAVALPGVGARTARAGLARGTGGCPPGSKLSCADQFGPTISECCSRPIPGSGNYTCCPPGQCFYSPTTNTCCPKAKQCAGECCGTDRECVDLTIGGRTRKTCVFRCPAGEHRCGSTLRPRNLGCCPNGKCCGESCCSGDQVCVTGLNVAGNPIKLCKLKCKDGMARCNFVCCKRGDRAYKKLPNGRVKCVCTPD